MTLGLQEIPVSRLLGACPEVDDDVSSEGGNCVSRWMGRTWRHIKDWVSESKVCDFLEKYTDLVGATATLGISILYFVGKVDSDVPEDVTKYSFVLLNVAKLISLNFELSLLNKVTGDLRLAYKTRNWKILGDSCFKSAIITSFVGVLCLETVASVTRLRGDEVTTEKLFSVIRPGGVSYVVSNFLLDIFHFVTNRPILHYLKSGLSFGELNVITDVLTERECSSLHFQNPSMYGALIKAADIRGRMDKDTWRTFKKTLAVASRDEAAVLQALFKEGALENIKTQQLMAGLNITGGVLGKIIITIAFMNPGTWVQAAIDMGAAGVHTTVLSIQKYQQANQRNSISHTMDEEEAIAMLPLFREVGAISGLSDGVELAKIEEIV